MEGKAKEAFDAWYINKARQRPDIGQRYFDEHLLEFLYNSGDTIKNAHIIEWLDSVGILIFLKRKTVGHRDFEFDYWYFIITNIQGVHLNNFLESKHHVIVDDRNEATEAAIKKAVEIFNEKYKE